MDSKIKNLSLAQIAEKIKIKPDVFFRLSKIKKAEGHVFISVNYFISNFINSKGNGYQIQVFKHPVNGFSVNIYEVKKRFISEKPIV